MRLFSRPKIEDLDKYVAAKDYDRALEAVAAELEKNPDKFNMLFRQAEILGRAGDPQKTIKLYRRLAERYARDGFYAKAIALYKRVLSIDPELDEVHRELAQLIEEDRVTRMPIDSPFGKAAAPPASVPPAAPARPRQPVAAPAPSREPTPVLQPAPGLAMEPKPLPQPAVLYPKPHEEPERFPPTPPTVTPEPLQMPELELDDDEYDPERERLELQASRLFASFENEALEEIICSTSVHSFSEGDIIVTEGEQGSSLFLIVAGKVKVFTLGERGEHLPLAELGPGDFFGEVSLLTGRPRTATITAKEPVALIELTKQDMDRIAGSHPEVRRVLEEFYERRAQMTVEAVIKRMRGEA